MKSIKFVRSIYEKRKKYFDEWYKYSKIIKGMAFELLGSAEVYVFGSVVNGEAHPVLSDIDVLVVSENMPNGHEERARLKSEMLKRIGPMNPFEIHLVNREEFEWYRRFLNKCVEIT